MRATRTLRRSRDPFAIDVADDRLRHVLVVGGSGTEWTGTDGARWAELMAELAHEVAAAGAEWLTLRPYGDDAAARGPVGSHQLDGCTVVIDTCADGRDRLVAAIEAVRRAAGPDGITEEAIGAALVAPADCEPDLALVLGPCDRLPPSLVWELAYSELVFTDCAWTDLGEKHIHDAIVEFNRRERRFGGLPS